MKRNIIPLVALVLLTACTTLYTTTVTITQVVDSAMRQWASLSVAGKTTSNLDVQVIAAHDKYREACGVAKAALIAYRDTGDQVAYVRALVAVRASVDSILSLITPLLSQKDATALHNQLSKAKSL